MSGQAIAWAHQQQVSGVARSVLTTIAWLADGNGVAIVSTSWLADYVKVSRSSVVRAFRLFQDKDLLVRVPRANEKNQSLCPAVYLNLKNQPIKPTKPTQEMTQPFDFEALKIAALRPQITTRADEKSSDKDLKALLDEIAHDGFNEANMQELADTLAANAAKKIKLGKDISMSRDEIVSAAWEIVHKKIDQVATSKQPWRYLSTAIKNSYLDMQRTTGPEVSYSPDLLDVPNEVRLPGEHALNSDTVLTYDDFGDKAQKFVEILIGSGVPEPIAWALTRRGLEIVAIKGRDQWYHTNARTDSELASYGLTPDAAAEFMNLFVGKRSQRVPKEQWGNRTAFFSSKLNIDDYQALQTVAKTLQTQRVTY